MEKVDTRYLLVVKRDARERKWVRKTFRTAGKVIVITALALLIFLFGRAVGMLTNLSIRLNLSLPAPTVDLDVVYDRVFAVSCKTEDGNTYIVLSADAEYTCTSAASLELLWREKTGVPIYSDGTIIYNLHIMPREDPPEVPIPVSPGQRVFAAPTLSRGCSILSS